MEIPKEIRTKMKDYIEDKYFLKYQDRIIERLKFYHNFDKYRILRHYRLKSMNNLEFDVLIITPKLKIGIELKEYTNDYKVFEQALDRLDYVDYQYVLIGFPEEIEFDLENYLYIAKYYEGRMEKFFKIGVILVSEKLNVVYFLKRAFTHKKVTKLLKYFNAFLNNNDDSKLL